LAVTLIVVAVSPAVLLCGELINRHYLGQLQARPRRILPGRAARRLRRHPANRPAVFLRHLGRPGIPISDVYLGHKTGPLALRFITNPVWIVLTAPARWIADRLRLRTGHGRGRGGPPSAGVREPRRPRPDQPAGAMALREPPS
jgi:hypothetical protein